jgi:hypothetical protein
LLDCQATAIANPELKDKCKAEGYSLTMDNMLKALRKTLVSSKSGKFHLDAIQLAAVAKDFQE